MLTAKLFLIEDQTKFKLMPIITFCLVEVMQVQKQYNWFQTFFKMTKKMNNQISLKWLQMATHSQTVPINQSNQKDQTVFLTKKLTKGKFLSLIVCNWLNKENKSELREEVEALKTQLIPVILEVLQPVKSPTKTCPKYICKRLNKRFTSNLMINP